MLVKKKCIHLVAVLGESVVYCIIFGENTDENIII